jgi:hypothetical protein
MTTLTDEGTPSIYRIDAANSVVQITLRGDVTVAALSGVEDAFFGDPHYRRGMSLFVDCRVVTSFPSEAELRQLASDRHERTKTMAGGRIAIVAMTRHGMQYANTWERLTESDDLHVFSTSEDARDWLGLPRDWI